MRPQVIVCHTNGCLLNHQHSAENRSPSDASLTNSWSHWLCPSVCNATIANATLNRPFSCRAHCRSQAPGEAGLAAAPQAPSGMLHSVAIQGTLQGHTFITWAAETMEGAIHICSQDVSLPGAADSPTLLRLQQLCQSTLRHGTDELAPASGMPIKFLYWYMIGAGGVLQKLNATKWCSGFINTTPH